MKLENISYPEQYVCKLTVRVSAEEFEEAIEANYQSKRENLKIKGYACGEATRAQAEAVRGEDFFWFDAANAVLDEKSPAVYEAAVAEHQLEVVSECSYDLETLSKAEGFTVGITFCLLPEFTFGDAKTITVTQKSAVVTDAEVEHIFTAQKDVKPELADEFRAKIREKLTENKAATVVAEAQSKVLIEFAAMAEGTLPTPMIDEAYEGMLTQLNELLQQHKTTMEDFLTKTGHSKEQFREDTRKGAAVRVRGTLAILRYGKMLAYTPTPAQVEAEIALRAEQVKDKLKDFAQNASRRRVALSMVRKKAMEAILADATILVPDTASAAQNEG
ncbi:MAG: trigger factor [Faecalibacterium sp.]